MVWLFKVNGGLVPNVLGVARFWYVCGRRYRYVIPYDKKTRVEIECKLIRIVNSELRLKKVKDKPSLQMDGVQEQRVFACLRF